MLRWLARMLLGATLAVQNNSTFKTWKTKEQTKRKKEKKNQKANKEGEMQNVDAVTSYGTHLTGYLTQQQ